jgi:hypothetical protein
LRRFYLQCSQHWSEIFCSFVQYQAVIIFKNSKHNIRSIIIFLLNYYWRKAIPNVACFFRFLIFSGFWSKIVIFRRRMLFERSNVVQITKYLIFTQKCIFKKKPLHSTPLSNNTSQFFLI